MPEPSALFRDAADQSACLPQNRSWRAGNFLRACLLAAAGMAGVQDALAQAPATIITPERPGLSAILPAQSFPVESDALEQPALELALESLDEDPFAAMPLEPEPVLQLDWQAGVDPLPEDFKVLLTGRLGTRSAARLTHAFPENSWVSAVDHIRYQQDNGSALSFGQISELTDFWGSSSRLGGVQVTRMPNVSSRGTLMPGTFGLSAVLGLSSSEDMIAAGTGSLMMGAPIGRGTARLGITPAFTLESQVQSRPEANSVGMGGTMAVNDWGVLRLSTTQTHPTALYPAGGADPLSPSWRSGLGIQLRLDQHQLESTYETMRENQSMIEQRLGIKHSWSITPELRMQIGADRELVHGGYSARMQLSVPFETLAGSWWRF